MTAPARPWIRSALGLISMIIALAVVAPAALAEDSAGDLSLAQQRQEWQVHVEEQRIAMKAYADKVDHARALADHEVFTYYVQVVFSVILTIFVLAMVGVAVWLSYLQFRADVGHAGGEKPTTFKISKDGLEMSSSIIGLFVLLAAMGFFYLYITEVYPIRPTAPAAPVPSSRAP